MSKKMDLPISISPLALKMILKTKSEQAIPDEYHLRLGLQGSGCQGEYLIGFDKREEDDQVFEVEGLSICIQKLHLMYLCTQKLEYREGEDEGFYFSPVLPS